MKISKQEFQNKLANNKLVISLIGMSNIGKTHWSKKLRKANFKHQCCDDLIEKTLEPELRALGYKGLADMAKWLGHPHESKFMENQKTYLKHELAVMENIIKNLSSEITQNMTVDTTGSVIYTGDEICGKLKEKSLIVFIEATPQMKEEMFKRFLSNPKPIIWANSFNKKENELDFEALKRCYPELLEYRTSQYRKHADIIIPYRKIDYRHTPEKFLELIKNHLP